MNANDICLITKPKAKYSHQVPSFTQVLDFPPTLLITKSVLELF